MMRVLNLQPGDSLRSQNVMKTNEGGYFKAREDKRLEDLNHPPFLTASHLQLPPIFKQCFALQLRGLNGAICNI